MNVDVREERASDAPAIRRVEEAAFANVVEANLVDALRLHGAVILSLVAETEGRIVGHICFSPVEIDPGRVAIGLAPVAVAPELQRRGIGSRLIREGLERLRTAGHGAVVLVGEPAYYSRFGFVRASSFGLRWDHPCPDELLQAVELRPGALAGGPGVIRYRHEFDSV